MTQENQTPTDPRDPLKDSNCPNRMCPQKSLGADDVLERAQIAAKLTNLIRDQSAPFAISIHGYWGTGKTFMLKRWQKDLENQGLMAIYFNAWEDDFCDDPLLAIIGQLDSHFKEGVFRTIADRIRETALPLLWRNALGVLNKTTGLTLETDQTGQMNLVAAPNI